MKHFCVLILFAMTAALSAAATKPAEAAKPAETTAKPTEAAKPAAAKNAVPVLTTIYSPDRDPAEFADPEKAADLLNRRAELAQKIQAERKRILKEDAKAKELNDAIMRQLRQLSEILETKKSMIELNSQLRDLDNAISRLKPAPPPEPDTKAETKADAKTDTKADGKKAEKE